MTFTRLAAPLLALALAGCSLVPPAQDVVLYQLRESQLAPASPILDRSLKVMAIDGSDALNNRRLLVSQDGAALQALPGARWTSPTRTLVRDRLLEGFAADGRIARLISDQAGLRGDLELHGTLRNFEGDLSGDQPAVYIRFDAGLADTATRTLLASRQFKVRLASAGAAPGDMVQAFSAATDQLALEVVNWIAVEASKPRAE